MIRQRRQPGDGPGDRQVISAGAAHPDAGLSAAHIHLGGPALLGTQACSRALFWSCSSAR
jgi:hypothetical protein